MHMSQGGIYMSKTILIVTSLFLVSLSARSNVNLADFNEEYVPSELIVKFKEGRSKSTLRSFSGDIKKEFRASEAVVVSFPSVVDIEKVANDLGNDPDVEYVELNQIYKLAVENNPNDESFPELYGMTKIQAPLAWSKTTGSKDILVGVIDSGVDYTHPDLAQNYWINEGEFGVDENGVDLSTNGIDDDGNGYIDDYKGWDFINGDNDPMDGNGHGTHCSGTIGAVGGNEAGVVGVNWNVSILGLKIFSDSGRTTTEAIVEGIEYSTLMNVDLTNNSWGGGRRSPTIEAAISEANDKGILFIAAAGNNRSDNDRRAFFPANYEFDNIISVASTDIEDKRSWFSNFGQTTVDVAAPGTNIFSTVPGGNYRNMSGTSMASPHVAGLAALIKSYYPEADLLNIKNRILHSGDSIEELVTRTLTGKRVNAFNSLSDDSIAPANVESFELVSDIDGEVVVQFEKSGDDNFEGDAQFYEVRWSNDEINSENWSASTSLPLEGLTSLEESVLQGQINGLPRAEEVFVAIRALDEAGNYSETPSVLKLTSIVEAEEPSE
jgi:subtilisin family serine protease